jgi:hypothetical protein
MLNVRDVRLCLDSQNRHEHIAAGCKYIDIFSFISEHEDNRALGLLVGIRSVASLSVLSSPHSRHGQR